MAEGQATETGDLRALARAALQAGKKAQALDLLARAAQTFPADAAAHADLGAVLVALNRPAEAISPLRRALGLEPTRIGAFIDLGAACQELGHLDQAQLAYRTALELDPRQATAYYNLGELLRRRGQLKEARRHFDAALRIEPRLMQACAGIGDIHLALGEFSAAAACYRQAIAANPGGAANPEGAVPYYMSLGIALKEMNEGEASLKAFRLAVQGDPKSAGAHFNLGSARLEFGQFPQARESLREALRLQPNLAMAHTLYGMAQAACGELSAGFASLERGAPLETSPAPLWAMLGAKLRSLARYELALECYRQLLQCDPENSAARHFVAALSGTNPDHAAHGYVLQLSESHAKSFDNNLINELGYTVPQELREELLAASAGAHSGVRAHAGAGSPGPIKAWDVLDLGCGTGLMGAALTAHSASLVGIDLSPKMIERAHARGIYTRLQCDELMAALDREQPASFDVITAADVFVYVGKLDAVMALVRRVLRRGGWFAFSTEAAEDALRAQRSGTPPATANEGHVLCASGRYAHSAAYLRELAASNHFEIKLLRKTRLRFEHRRPILGWLAIWGAQ